MYKALRPTFFLDFQNENTEKGWPQGFFDVNVKFNFGFGCGLS
jgi:hypothetical protein